MGGHFTCMFFETTSVDELRLRVTGGPKVPFKICLVLNSQNKWRS